MNPHGLVLISNQAARPGEANKQTCAHQDHSQHTLKLSPPDLRRVERAESRAINCDLPSSSSEEVATLFVRQLHSAAEVPARKQIKRETA